MLTVNIDMEDRLINGQTGVKFSQVSVRRVHVKLSNEQTGLKAVR